MKKKKRIMFSFLVILLFILLALFFCFFVGKTKPSEEIIWGVNFSQKHAHYLGLDWKENYIALLDDLGASNLKVATYWDLLEPKEGDYSFDDLDWQISETERRNAEILLVVGMKAPRWPECHIPEWAKGLRKEQQQEKILELVENIVLRYRNSPAIKYWQVENEPFFPFGECPWVDKKFLREEVKLVKSLDSKSRPIIMSDSGEGSLWITAARYGDIVGTTMYQKVWFRQIGIYVSYPFPEVFYWRKAQFIKKIFGKEVIVVELQAEPWGPKLLYDTPLEEQKKTMNLEQFKKNMEFARNTGLREFYLWGGEWMYWMKTQGYPEIWEEAKKLFK